MPKKFGPGSGPGNAMVAEKAKDFKGSIIRTFKELGQFKILITIAMILAIISAAFSIFAPNKLSSLTDKISDGLSINKENLEILTNKITENLSSEIIKEKVYGILDINITNEDILAITQNENVPLEDKQKFREIITMEDSKNFDFSHIPESILINILKESTYNGTLFTVQDKIEILNTAKDFNNISNINLSEKMQNALFDEIEIMESIITPSQQYEFLKIMASIDENSNVQEIYKNMENLPENIYDIIKPKMDIQSIKNITLFLLCIYIVSALFNYIQSICMTDVSNKFAKNLRSRISNKINKLELKYFDRHELGDLLSRVTNDVDNVAQSMNQSLAGLVSNITLFLGSIIMMFYTNYIMALTAIFSSLIGFSFVTIILKKSQKYFIEKQVQLGNLNGHIEEIYSGLNVVKVYNGKEASYAEFDKLNKRVCESNRKSQFLSGLMHPLMGFIGNFGYVAVCIVGALLAANNMITFGVIVAFITYVRLFTNPLSQIAQAMTSLQVAAASSERVFEFLDEDEMKSEENITKKLDKEKVKGNVEFKDVVFQYDDNDHPTINGFTASAKPGQKIAIVGPTGAGKTTMVNLLMKFYDINSGNILIDGTPISELTRENIHSLFTMVLQDTWLFEGTIKENIVYNRKNISDERVEEVCKIVGLDHFIKTLPDGINTKLTENDSISAGQKQLLTIARGMIEDSPFLILDEATSNVDTRTEELVQKAMDKLTEGRTSFIIAHRLSTIKNADLILVVNDGNIIEQGNHDTLMKKGGFYATLYNSQFEL